MPKPLRPPDELRELLLELLRELLRELVLDRLDELLNPPLERELEPLLEPPPQDAPPLLRVAGKRTGVRNVFTSAMLWRMMSSSILVGDVPAAQDNWCWRSALFRVTVVAAPASPAAVCSRPAMPALAVLTVAPSERDIPDRLGRAAEADVALPEGV